MKNLLLLGLFISVCLSCNTLESEDVQFVRLSDFEKVDKISWGNDKYFKSCFPVKLELTEKSMISSIAQMEIFEKKIYILDSTSKQILVFDWKGKYLYAIGQKGSGPEEYLSISGFYVDGGIVNLFDPLNMAVYQYETSGKFCQRIKHENPNLTFIKKSIPVNENELFAYSASNWEDNAMYLLVDRTNYKTIKNLRYYPGNPKEYISYFYFRQPFSTYDNKITFGMLFSDTLSIYEDHKVSPELVIKSKATMPDKILNRKAEDVGYNYSSVIREVNQEGKYNTGIWNIFENKRFLFCELKTKDCMEGIVFDKLNNQGVLMTEYCHQSPDLGTFFISHNNTIIRIWSNDDIGYFKEYLEKGKVNKEKYPEELLEMIREYDVYEDNPILLFYEFKED